MDDLSVTRAIDTAEDLLRQSLRTSTRREARRSRRLGRLLADEAGREFLQQLSDEVLRAAPAAVTSRLARLVAEVGVPTGLGPFDRLGLRAAAIFGPRLPRIVGPLVTRRVLAETRGVLLAAEDPAFAAHVARRRRDGVRLNVNVLGEAILGDDEAAARLAKVRARLARDDVDYVSIKISSLCANLDVLAFDASVARIIEPLRTLYRDAAAFTPPKFVNLDMEEYRDLDLTIAAFTSVLDSDEFGHLPAGIVVQAYLPDSQHALERLCDWASTRFSAGGAPIKIRIVKGANLASESVEAELHGWEQAPYDTKAAVDANAKRLLDIALSRPVPGAVRVGVGSHNLFEVAWALTLRDELGVDDRVEIEMLEGMAPAMARAAQHRANGLLMYAPVVGRDDLGAAIAYLSRRLDENSTPENFLQAMFDLEPGSARWRLERDRFTSAVHDRAAVSGSPRRHQDRTIEPAHRDGFFNAPDTDFALAHNRRWIEQVLSAPSEVDPPPVLTTVAQIDDVVERARVASAAWTALDLGKRRSIIAAVADVMEHERGRTIAVMAAETGKTVREGDPEVSEAVDFARYAAHSAALFDQLADDGVAVEPLGVVLVCAPWNFPYAIPAGNVLHALVAGNAVILKPAPEARRVGAMLVDHLHRAGVPADVVQIVACPDDEVGRHLVTHDHVDAVILTGSRDTASMFLSWKPALRLYAETSGKNAIVVTEAADVDLAIRDLVRSAFGHAGQKCSAASLAIVTRSVIEDTTFLARLADAVRSLRVGPADDLSTMVGPLIASPTGALDRALTTLEPGESWLVAPQRLDTTGRLWSPGVRTGVRPGSWFHRTECFGPVLGIITVADLDEAIMVQNDTDFGLTGGLQSLDRTEIDHWLAAVEVGNAYINRAITGAIVQRQPFGGWKASSVGAASKMGGPDYLLAMVRLQAPTSTALAVPARPLAHNGDPTGLRCESNVLRHRPLVGVIVRIDQSTDNTSREHLAAFAARAGTPVSWSSATAHDDPTVIIESDTVLAARLDVHQNERLRVLCPIDEIVRIAAHRAGVTVDETPLTGHDRVEFGRWVKEQSVSETRHRHGRLQPGPAAAVRAARPTGA